MSGKKKKPEKPKHRLYVDIEAVIEPEGHRANLLICDAVRSDGEFLKQWVYKGFDCVTKFVRDVLSKNSPFADSYVICHNNSAYDGLFILKELVARQQLPTNYIFRGQSILSLEFPNNNVELRDSLQFLQSSLEALPKMFGVADESKGKHNLNNSNNSN